MLKFLFVAGATLWFGIAPSMAFAQKSLWEVSAGAIFLNRDASYENAFVFDDSDEVVIGESAIETGTQSGLDINVTRNLSDSTSVHTRFFFVDEWTASASSPLTNGGFVGGSAIAGDIGFTQVDAVLTSDLYSGEINLVRQRNAWLKLLAGFRWLSIDESASAIFFNGPTREGEYAGTVDNDLFGFQIGADALLVDRGRFNVNTIVKGGLYGINTETDGRYENGVSATLNDSESGIAFVGEVGVNCNYQLTNNIWITGGYQLLWVNGIGVLTEQYDNVNWVNGSGIDTDGSALYHGAVVSMTFLLP